jgi:hypothetical protein
MIRSPAKFRVLFQAAAAPAEPWLVMSPALDFVAASVMASGLAGAIGRPTAIHPDLRRYRHIEESTESHLIPFTAPGGCHLAYVEAWTIQTGVSSHG